MGRDRLSYYPVYFSHSPSTVEWLWDARHGVQKQDRWVLLRLFRDVLYAECEEKLSNKLKVLYADPVYNRYPQYQEHLGNDAFPKIDAWSLAHRFKNKLPTSNNKQLLMIFFLFSH